MNLLVRSFTKALDKREVEEVEDDEAEADEEGGEGDEDSVEDHGLNLELTLPTCKCNAMWPLGTA